MMSAKQKRVVFILYIGAVFLSVVILFLYTGLDSPWPWMCVSFIVLTPVLYMKLFQLPYIIWKESYSVGVAKIDHDHKILLELINRVVSASSYNLGEEFSREIFGKLIDYARHHLDWEEKMMEEYDFPGQENHKLQHNKFIGRINDFYSQLDSSGDIAHHEIFDFLRDWLLSHIGKTDKELGAYLQTIQVNAVVPVG